MPGKKWKEMAMLGNKMAHLQYRVKPFGLMVLLALSAAVFGIMAVHKLREKRALGVLLRERDRELYDHQILLQKERDQTQEILGKTKEMKEMIYTLLSQKKYLHARIREMESTISSLQDDHQAMVTTLEDRANEIKALREKEMDLSRKESEESSLREIIRLKEAEIEDLTRRLDSSMQASNAHPDNTASPVNADESNGVDGGNSKGMTGLEGVAEESSEMSAQASDIQEKIKLKEVMEGSNRHLRRGQQTRDSDLLVLTMEMNQDTQMGEEVAASDGEVKEAEGEHGNGEGDDSGKQPQYPDGAESNNSEDHVENTDPQETAEQNENHQDTQMGEEVASSDGEVKEAEGEHGNSEGDDSGKQPQYPDEAESNNSEDHVENTDPQETATNDGSSLMLNPVENANHISSLHVFP